MEKSYSRVIFFLYVLDMHCNAKGKGTHMHYTCFIFVALTIM